MTTELIQWPREIIHHFEIGQLFEVTDVLTHQAHILRVRRIQGPVMEVERVTRWQALKWRVECLLFKTREDYYPSKNRAALRRISMETFYENRTNRSRQTD